MLERQRTPAEKLSDAKEHAEQYVSAADEGLHSAREELSTIDQKIAQVSASIERIQETMSREEDVAERARLDSTLVDKRFELLKWQREKQQIEEALQKVAGYRDSTEASVATMSEEFKKHLN